MTDPKTFVDAVQAGGVDFFIGVSDSLLKNFRAYGTICAQSPTVTSSLHLSHVIAAHAFSYYLTSHYGIPHGHAVYMVFPYICINNGHPEYIRKSAHLSTLREFAAEKGLEWNQLVDDLFNHVNLKRLGNNPVEVKKESFV